MDTDCSKLTTCLLCVAGVKASNAAFRDDSPVAAMLPGGYDACASLRLFSISGGVRCDVREPLSEISSCLNFEFHY
jgi:hypothetical protein